MVTARLLGPAGFAHATAVYTILMLMSAITLSFQVVCAKYVAESRPAEDGPPFLPACISAHGSPASQSACSIFLSGIRITSYLNLPDPVLISLLALGTAFYIPLGVRRGYIQGIHAFGPWQSISCWKDWFGWAELFTDQHRPGRKRRRAGQRPGRHCHLFRGCTQPRRWSGSVFVECRFLSAKGLQAIVFFSGQTVINNFDIVLVKHFFPSDEAGLYAAVALVGRLVNMCAWSVVNTMFPVSAGAASDEQEGGPVLFTSLLLVFLILSVLIFGFMDGAQFPVENALRRSF